MGRASRIKREKLEEVAAEMRRRNIRQLTGGRCGRIATRIRQGVEGIGLDLEDCPDLLQMARDAESFAKAGDGPVNPRLEEMWAFLRMEQAERLGNALSNLRSVRNAEKAGRWLGQRLDRLATQDAKAQDYVFEVEIAGRFARLPIGVWLGDDASGEPDISIGWKDEPLFAIECKRARSIGGVANLVRTARRQLRRTDLSRVIILGLEAIFHRSDDPQRPTVFYATDTLDEGIAEAERLALEAESAAGRELRKAYNEGVGGMISCGVFTCLYRRPKAAYAYRWINRSTGREDTLEAIQNIQGFLFGPNEPRG